MYLIYPESFSAFSILRLYLNRELKEDSDQARNIEEANNRQLTDFEQVACVSKIDWAVFVFML
jgi:hypothetical protein